MSTKTFEEKLEIVKRQHLSSHPDAINTIFEWEEKYIRLKAQDEWLQHPNTRELLSLAIEQVNAINSILKDTEDLSEEQRTKYFQFKKAHLVYIAALSTDPKSQMKNIESLIDDEIKIEDYE